MLKRLLNKFSFVYGSVLSDFMGTGAESQKEKAVLGKIYVRENISCASKIELPYYSVDILVKVCVYCGIQGTTRTLGNSAEYYPKCGSCNERPDVPRRKRKSVVAADLGEKKRN